MACAPRRSPIFVSANAGPTRSPVGRAARWSAAGRPQSPSIIGPTAHAIRALAGSRQCACVACGTTDIVHNADVAWRGRGVPFARPSLADECGRSGPTDCCMLRARDWATLQSTGGPPGLQPAFASVDLLSVQDQPYFVRRSPRSSIVVFSTATRTVLAVSRRRDLLGSAARWIWPTQPLAGSAAQSRFTTHGEFRQYWCLHPARLMYANALTIVSSTLRQDVSRALSRSR